MGLSRHVLKKNIGLPPEITRNYYFTDIEIELPKSLELVLSYFIGLSCRKKGTHVWNFLLLPISGPGHMW